MSLKNTHSVESLVEYSDYSKIKKDSKPHVVKLTRVANKRMLFNELLIS